MEFQDRNNKRHTAIDVQGPRLGKVFGGVNPKLPTKKTSLKPHLPMKKAFLAFQRRLAPTVYCKFADKLNFDCKFADKPNVGCESGTPAPP